MVDWRELFSFSVPVVELILRGSAIYWFLFLVFRFVVRRDIGAIGIADVLLLVMVSDAAQNGMDGGYQSLSDAFVLIATLVAWNYLLDGLSFHFPKVRRFCQAGLLVLVRDGRILERNLRREYISKDELMTQLRTKGIDKLAQVKRAYMESDGQISVIRRDHDDVDDKTSSKVLPH